MDFVLSQLSLEVWGTQSLTKWNNALHSSKMLHSSFAEPGWKNSVPVWCLVQSCKKEGHLELGQTTNSLSLSFFKLNRSTKQLSNAGLACGLGRIGSLTSKACALKSSWISPRGISWFQKFPESMTVPEFQKIPWYFPKCSKKSTASPH